MLSLPAALAAGEQWSYRITWGSLDPYEQDFVIDEVSAQDVTVRGGAATLELEIVDQGLSTREMCVEDDGGYVAVRFSPSLPDLEQLHDGDQQALDFTIDIDGRLDQITGGLTVERQADLVELWLSPQTPAWAVINQIHVELELSDTGYDLRVETVQSDAPEP